MTLASVKLNRYDVGVQISASSLIQYLHMIFQNTSVRSQTPEQYLNTLMKQVSRSFALVVPNLEEPLNHYIATAYLLCRAVDNIEDCTQPFAWKEARFAEFQDLLEAPDLAPQILSRWSQLD